MKNVYNWECMNTLHYLLAYLGKRWGLKFKYPSNCQFNEVVLFELKPIMQVCEKANIDLNFNEKMLTRLFFSSFTPQPPPPPLTLLNEVYRRETKKWKKKA